MANNRNGTKDQVVQKEAAAFRLRQHGWSQLRIANHLGMTQQGVSKSLKRITKRFAQHFLNDVRLVKTEQVAQLDNIVHEAMRAWYKSKKGYSKTDLFGDPRHLHVAMKAMEETRKIVGASLPEEPNNDEPITAIKITVIKPENV